MAERGGSANQGLEIGDPISVTIEKFDPSRDAAPSRVTYEVPYTKEMRVLEALDYIVEELGESLAYQWFCGVKKCGMCGVMVNGRQTLGCWEPVEREMTVQPLAGFPVVRDLVIDRSHYFSQVQKLRPWLERARPYAGFPEDIDGEVMADAAETMHCIECMLCVSACPADGEDFMGPAPMVQLARFALDPRDGADRAATAWNEGGIAHCVGCHQCTRFCPADIRILDGAIAGLEARVREAGLDGHRTLRDRLFANVHGLGRIGSRLAPVANPITGSRLGRRLLEGLLGVDRRRTLPRFASRPFDAWFAGRRAPGDAAGRTPVALFHDTFVTYFEPEIGEAATGVLEAAGYAVSLVTDRACCGRPMLSGGDGAAARAAAERNVRALAPLVRDGVPVVGLEPSCVLTIRESYPDLLGGDEARRVAGGIRTFEEFVADEARAGRLRLDFTDPPDAILLHGHCHQKAMIGTGPALETLALTGAPRVEEIATTCCGMAGSNGYEREHYDRSLQAAEVSLLPAVRAAPASAVIAAAGVSCRQQIRDGAGREPRHPAQVLHDALGGAGR